MRRKREDTKINLFLVAEEQCSTFMHATRQAQRLQNITTPKSHSIQNLETSEKGITCLLLTTVKIKLLSYLVSEIIRRVYTYYLKPLQHYLALRSLNFQVTRLMILATILKKEGGACLLLKRHLDTATRSSKQQRQHLLGKLNDFWETFKGLVTEKLWLHHNTAQSNGEVLTIPIFN